MTDLMLEWFGYMASGVIAISLLMNSLLRLRWINLIGAAMFSTYGFLIGAMPVFILNGFIVLINVFYLFQIYNKKEYFKILEIKSGNLYLKDFLSYYSSEIAKYIPHFQFKERSTNENLFILRNMQVVGVFLAHRYDDETLMIDLDFAVPEYRDFKLAKFVFNHQQEYFQSKGYNKLYTRSQSDEHNSYLKRIGFEEIELDSVRYFVRRLF